MEFLNRNLNIIGIAARDGAAIGAVTDTGLSFFGFDVDEEVHFLCHCHKRLGLQEIWPDYYPPQAHFPFMGMADSSSTSDSEKGCID